jgi:oxygen-dependent protoporphyrinogen oxidase
VKAVVQIVRDFKPYGMPRVLIVGGGISGLSTAWYLAKAGILRRSSNATTGSAASSRRITSRVVSPRVARTASSQSSLQAKNSPKELGMGGDLFGSNDHQRATFIWRGGRLLKLPDGMTMMVPAKIAPILKTRF